MRKGWPQVIQSKVIDYGFSTGMLMKRQHTFFPTPHVALLVISPGETVLLRRIFGKLLRNIVVYR